MLKRYGLPTVYLLIVFVCGLAVGVFGYRLYELRNVSASAPGPPKNPEEWKQRHLTELRERLKLTDTQLKQVSSVMDGARKQYQSFFERFKPEIERIQDDQYAKVRALLTPEQAAEYDKLRAEREARRKQRPPAFRAPGP